MIQVPVVKAMVLADQVYTDGESGKRVICGTFSRLNVASKMPGSFGRATYAFILLSDGLGDCSLRLRFVHLDSNKILMESHPMDLELDNPLKTLDIVMAVPPFPLVGEGFYSLECWIDTNLVGSVRLEVVKVEIERQ